MHENPNIEMICRQEETALRSILGTDEAPLVVELIGTDTDKLEELSNLVMLELSDLEGLQNISSSIEGGAPEVDIKIDRYQAGMMNIDVNTLISRVSEKLQGTNAGQMDIKGELKDITVKLEDISLKELEVLTINVNNIEVLLREVAEISIGNSPREILHNNQNRIVRITADLDGNAPLDKMAGAIDQPPPVHGISARIQFPDKRGRGTERRVHEQPGICPFTFADPGIYGTRLTI